MSSVGTERLFNFHYLRFPKHRKSYPAAPATKCKKSGQPILLQGVARQKLGPLLGDAFREAYGRGNSAGK